jgi:hypothetical protein
MQIAATDMKSKNASLRCQLYAQFWGTKMNTRRQLSKETQIQSYLDAIAGAGHYALYVAKTDNIKVWPWRYDSLSGDKTCEPHVVDVCEHEIGDLLDRLDEE